jgi:glycosyltransferase involved in cell wall biosynthesis
MRGTGSLNGYIRVCKRPDDAELAFLYQNCLFTVYPSYYEGWGLPIGESLWFRKLVVTSETSSMPEVGGSLVDYVNPYSIQSVLNGVKRALDPDYVRERTAAIKPSALRTWKDVSEDLWDQVQAFSPVANRSTTTHAKISSTA